MQKHYQDTLERAQNAPVKLLKGTSYIGNDGRQHTPFMDAAGNIRKEAISESPVRVKSTQKSRLYITDKGVMKDVKPGDTLQAGDSLVENPTLEAIRQLGIDQKNFNTAKSLTAMRTAIESRVGSNQKALSDIAVKNLIELYNKTDPAYVMVQDAGAPFHVNPFTPGEITLGKNSQAHRVPRAHYIALLQHANDPKVVADFKAKYGFLPAGIK